MKRYFIIVLGMIISAIAYSQPVRNWTEDFEGTVTFKAFPTGSWIADTTYYYQVGTGTPNPKSYLGWIPYSLGDTCILQSPVYDLSIYNYISLRFDHICKVSPLDVARLEYRRTSEGWKPVPYNSYKSRTAANYNTLLGFNAASYTDWKSNDSTAFPAQSWWKSEHFDVAYDVSLDANVEFRFIIIRGKTHGTQISYGWLIDNFRIDASVYELNPPVVQFINYVQDTVYATGPYDIKVKAAKRTSFSLETPWLVYITTYNGVSRADSVLMTSVEGDSIWTATLPQFVAGTTVAYSVTGKDTVGNESTTPTATYTIAVPSSSGLPSFVEVSGATSATSCWTPTCHCEQYAWTRNLYLASDLGTTSEGAVIVAIEWQSAATSGSYTLNNQKCFLEATTNTTIVAGYVDPASVGATKVLDGTFTITPGWCRFDFSQSFFLPAGKNLQIHWESLDGRSNPGGFDLLHHKTSYNSVADAHSTSSAAAIYSLPGNPHADRPNARFHFLTKTYDHSAAIHSIDIADTIPCSPGKQVPVVVTFKNKGNIALTSANVNFSVNGVAGTLKSPYPSWTGNLAWDINEQDTIGYYIPKANGDDIIKVWIDSPNGQTDSSAYDDTLTKTVYGSSDITITFEDVPKGTIDNKTGPFNFILRITSRSGASIPSPFPVSLVTDYKGNSTNSTLNLIFDANDQLWKATIPQNPYGSTIHYAISYTDVNNNLIELEDSVYLNRKTGGVSGYVEIGQGTVETQYNIYYTYWYQSHSRNYYMAYEIDPNSASGGTISKIAFYVNRFNSGSSLNTPVSFYLKADPDSVIRQNDYVDPMGDGATKVWGAATHSIGTGWQEITLNAPFELPAGKNLLVYCNNEQSSYQNYYPYWRCTNVSRNGSFHTYSSGSGWSSKTTTTTRPNLRLLIEGKPAADTSVALEAIESPLTSESVGSTVPVRVRIKNVGIHNLTDCTIKWTLNGGAEKTQPWTSTTWTDGLPEEFSETITLDTYTPRGLGIYDTLVVWVENPNGITDSKTDDDLMTLYIRGCSGNTQGLKTVGTGGDFATIAEAITLIRECGLSGDLTLQLKGTYTTSIDLSNIDTRGYHLTITSLDNDADSVIIQPTSGVGITLGNTRNISIEKITVDRESVSAHAIQFTAACTNIVIRECKLLVNPTVSTNYISPIYKPNSTGVADSIFIIKNILRGGVTNIWFYGGTGVSESQFGKHIVIDSNTLTGAYYHIIKGEYTDFAHISYNSMSPRAYSSSATANHPDIGYGIERCDALVLHNCNGDIIGNRISCLTDRYTEYFHIQDFNRYNATRRALIANNEIIHKSARRTVCIMHDRAHTDMVHNSFYLSAPTTDVSIFYLSDVANSNLYFRNNNVVLTASPTITVFGGTSVVGRTNYDFDYNNFYNQNSTSHLNYHTSMQHVISVMPPYLDISQNLDLLAGNSSFNCPIIPIVTTDINGRPRTGQATMGAYQIIPVSEDLALTQFVSLDPEVVENQSVQITVEVQNQGNNPVQNAVFGWSVNGQMQTPYSWTPTALLMPFVTANVSIGSFTVTNSVDKYDIVVWVDSINHVLDMNDRLDTLKVTTTKMPLASWASPFVADTITALTFDVYAKIRSGTGAPISTRQRLKLKTTINGNYVIEDSVVMTLANGIWKASIPQQYYGSNVVYSMTVTDTNGISCTITDSVYIKYSESTSATYSGYNLTISGMTNPVNDPNDLCTPDMSPVRAVISNIGASNYDFSRTFIFLYAEVINPQGTRDTAFLIKNTGTLDSKKSDTIELMSSLSVKYAGRYKIKVWMSSSLDYVPYDDTLIYEYISGRISLPIDEDFSSGIIPVEKFASEAVNPKVETNVWMPYTDTDGKIVPPEGSGMIIRYAGNGKRGAMTKLTVRQLDLSGSVDPKLEFWYYYDSTANPLDDSYTEIRIVKDYVPEIVLNLLKKDDTFGYGWHLHTVNLNPYKDGECVLIEFESMNKYDLSSQYMSHLQVTSTPDLEVFDILISPEITACEMDNKDIQVVLKTTANQVMDFVNNPTSIAVEIPGMQIPPYILQDAIAGNSMDTVTVATGIDLTTVTDIKVYLTAPVDNSSNNDTVFRELDYNPELELTVIPATGNGSCYKKGISVYQRVALKNSGNMDLYGIKMQLILTAGDNYTDTVNEPGTVDLLKDSTLMYDFASSYIVPEEDYTVKVIAWLECAPGRIDTIHAAGECVDLHNLSLISIDSPLDNQIDTMGTTQQISVTLQNTDVLNAFENVDITALVESKQGQVLQTITETLPRVEPSARPAFTFNERYTVPSDSLYIIRVYISSGDLYTENDTLFVQGQAVPADTNVGIAYRGNLSGFSLGQNIPNPANNSTRIDYSIPTADDVMFYVHSVNGQLLYAEKISTPRGTHTIELNTAMFAAGIYFYSIEYKGQKQVKKLTINN